MKGVRPLYSAMLVDDEKWTMLGLCRSFRWARHGFELAFFSTDPQAAFEYLLEKRPDAAFLDIRMPGLSGIEILRGARRAGLETEFVIISAVQDFEAALSCIRESAFDYLLKPLDMGKADDLLARLGAHLGASRGETAPRGPEEDKGNFERLVRHVDRHFREPLRLKELSARFYLTPNYVSSLFRSRLQTTFKAYLTALRIESARRLLEGSGLSVEEVAELCGYAETEYFIRVFRARAGVTPLQYRKGARE